MIEQRASRDGAELCAWFQDVESGEVVARESYQKMLAFLRRKGADRVYVWESSRLGRNDREFLRCCWELEDLGIDVVSCTQDIQNVLMRYIYAWKGQEDNRELGRRVATGMKTAATKGRWLGLPPYGYRADPVTRQLIVCPEEAAVIRQIFEECAQGKGYRSQCIRLNGMGIPSPTGKFWWSGQLNRILTNRTYLGFTKNKYIDKLTHEPIISQELFDMATHARQQRTHAGKGVRSAYLLSTLVYCGYCGSRMAADGRRNKKSGGPSYVCDTYTQRGGCKRNAIKCSTLEDHVVGEIKRLMDPMTFDQECLKRRQNRVADIGSQIKNTQKQIGEVSRGLQRAWDLVLAEHATVEEFVEQKQRLLEQKAMLLQKLSELEEYQREQEVRDRRAADISLVLKEMESGWETADISKRKVIVHALIERIIVRSAEEEIQIEFRF